MIVLQKIIKAFAVCLAGGIILGMVGILISLVGFLGIISGGADFDYQPPSVVWEETNQAEVQNLEISLGAVDLQIVEDAATTRVRVETNLENIASWQEGNTLKVVNKGNISWFNFGGSYELTVYLPKQTSLQQVDIDAGAGRVKIDHLIAKRIKMELGAGKAEIAYLEASEFAQIEGGAGAIELRDGKLKKSELEIGTGHADITAELAGGSKIGSGVGRLDLKLKPTLGGYKYMVDKGLGSVTIDGVSQSDDAVYGQGESLIKLDCGVGSVEVRTVE